MSDTSPADELRTAADKIRALVAEATSGPWYVVMDEDDDASGFNYGLGSAPGLRDIAGNSWNDGGFERVADARYAAAMHPSVGAGLAAWLDSWSGIEVREDGPLPEDLQHALAVARAINGSPR